MSVPGGGTGHADNADISSSAAGLKFKVQGLNVKRESANLLEDNLHLFVIR